MSGEIISFDKIIENAFSNLSEDGAEKSLGIYNEWKNILSKIKSVSGNVYEGRNMADHSRISDLKNGILVVEVDHPGWMELIQFHKKFILNGLKMKFPDVKIKGIFFRLKENESASKKSDEKKAARNLLTRVENEEKVIGEKFKNPRNEEKIRRNKEIPPELQSIFDDLKKSMLTNAEK